MVGHRVRRLRARPAVRGAGVPLTAPARRKHVFHVSLFFVLNEGALYTCLRWRGFHIGGVAYLRTLHFNALKTPVGVDAELVTCAVVLPGSTFVNIWK